MRADDADESKPVRARLRSFAARLVRILDHPDPDHPIDGDDIVQTKDACGGRIEKGVFLITYFAGSARRRRKRPAKR